MVPVFGQMTVTLGATVVESPIGSNGEFYLEGIRPGVHAATIASEVERMAPIRIARGRRNAP